MVRVSGQDTPLAESRSDLESKGFVFDDRTVAGRPAAVGAHPDDTLQAFLIIDNGTSSIVVLSHDLTRDELAALAETLRPADQTAWADAGGQIL